MCDILGNNKVYRFLGTTLCISSSFITTSYCHSVWLLWYWKGLIFFFKVYTVIAPFARRKACSHKIIGSWHLNVCKLVQSTPKNSTVWYTGILLTLQHLSFTFRKLEVLPDCLLKLIFPQRSVFWNTLCVCLCLLAVLEMFCLKTTPTAMFREFFSRTSISSCHIYTLWSTPYVTV